MPEEEATETGSLECGGKVDEKETQEPCGSPVCKRSEEGSHGSLRGDCSETREGQQISDERINSLEARESKTPTGK
jgi:hypothetical protein